MIKKKKRILLNTDPGDGLLKDVDDIFAILMALSRSEIELEGVLINFGNANAKKANQVAKEVLNLAGSDVPVLFGAASKKDLGKKNAAVDFMLEKVRESPGEITLVNIAPNTNVASAMMFDKTFSSNLKEMIVMGGAIDFRFFKHFGEFNFHKDGPATTIAMKADCKKTLFTMDLCSQAVFKKEHLEMIREKNTPMSKYLSKVIPPWLLLNQLVFWKGGFFPWDPIAMSYLFKPELFDERYFSFDTVDDGIKSGKMFNLKEHINPTEEKEKLFNIPQKMNATAFMDLLMEDLLSF